MTTAIFRGRKMRARCRCLRHRYWRKQQLGEMVRTYMKTSTRKLSWGRRGVACYYAVDDIELFGI